VAGWFVIIYRVPSSPSTARVTVWKKIKELGALPLQQSVYILPGLTNLKDSLVQLQDQITQLGGECRILEVFRIEESQEKELIDGFNRLRTEEYEEILEECEAFFDEVERETRVEKFYFSEVEEIEKRLQGLKEWFQAVVRRDFFNLELRNKVAEVLQECEDRFDEFSRNVLSREETIVGNSKLSMATLKLKDAGKQERAVYSRSRLIAKLKELVSKIESNSLDFDGNVVGKLPDTATVEFRYRTRRNVKSLEIKIDWANSAGEE